MTSDNRERMAPDGAPEAPYDDGLALALRQVLALSDGALTFHVAGPAMPGRPRPGDYEVAVLSARNGEAPRWRATHRGRRMGFSPTWTSRPITALNPAERRAVVEGALQRALWIAYDELGRARGTVSFLQHEHPEQSRAAADLVAGLEARSEATHGRVRESWSDPILRLGALVVAAGDADEIHSEAELLSGQARQLMEAPLQREHVQRLMAGGCDLPPDIDRDDVVDACRAVLTLHGRRTVTVGMPHYRIHGDAASITVDSIEFDHGTLYRQPLAAALADADFVRVLAEDCSRRAGEEGATPRLGQIAAAARTAQRRARRLADQNYTASMRNIAGKPERTRHTETANRLRTERDELSGLIAREIGEHGPLTLTRDRWTISRCRGDDIEMVRRAVRDSVTGNVRTVRTAASWDLDWLMDSTYVELRNIAGRDEARVAHDVARLRACGVSDDDIETIEFGMRRQHGSLETADDAWLSTLSDDSALHRHNLRGSILARLADLVADIRAFREACDRDVMDRAKHASGPTRRVHAASRLRGAGDAPTPRRWSDSRMLMDAAAAQRDAATAAQQDAAARHDATAQRDAEAAPERAPSPPRGAAPGVQQAGSASQTAAPDLG